LEYRIVYHRFFQIGRERMKLLMIFNENFVVGERYRADTVERFRVVDVESTSDAWFSIGKRSSIVFRRESTGEILRVRFFTAQRLSLKRSEG